MDKGGPSPRPRPTLGVGGRGTGRGGRVGPVRGAARGVCAPREPPRPALVPRTGGEPWRCLFSPHARRSRVNAAHKNSTTLVRRGPSLFVIWPAVRQSESNSQIFITLLINLKYSNGVVGSLLVRLIKKSGRRRVIISNLRVLPVPPLPVRGRRSGSRRADRALVGPVSSAASGWKHGPYTDG